MCGEKDGQEKQRREEADLPPTPRSIFVRRSDRPESPGGEAGGRQGRVFQRDPREVGPAMEAVEIGRFVPKMEKSQQSVGLSNVENLTSV